MKVANGDLINCSYELPDLLWGIQGQTFRTTFKVIPLGSYDSILGMDWLECHSSMSVHWKDKRLEFTLNGERVQLQGVKPHTTVGSPVSAAKLQAMQKTNAILFMVQLSEASCIQQQDSVWPEEIQNLINQFNGLFKEPVGLPPARPGDHQIPLVPSAQPFRLRPYRFNPAQQDEIEKQISEMLDKGWIQLSSSPFSSPILLVKKKTGDRRLCVDFRRLNALTIKNKYPLPIIDEILDELFGACWFSSLDLCSGFHQIRMKKGEEFKTAFQTHSGHYEYKVMPYGVTGGPATFQEVMNDILAPLLRKCVVVFIDDILIYSKTWEDHLAYIQQVFLILQEHQFLVKLAKVSIC